MELPTLNLPTPQVFFQLVMIPLPLKLGLTRQVFLRAVELVVRLRFGGTKPGTRPTGSEWRGMQELCIISGGTTTP